MDLAGKTFERKPAKIPKKSDAAGITGKIGNMLAVWTPVEPKYKMEDLVLEPSVREELLDITAYYRCMNKIMDEWGLRDRYNNRTNLTVNLYGDSGTGKTMAAHAIAHALNKQVIFVDYAEIESKYVGETAKNIKRLFHEASESGAIIVFDEADALLSKRVTDMRSSSDVSVNQTRSVLLNILNEYSGVVIFTTNFIQNFDPAFLRRIRYQVKFQLPNEELREQLWEMYIPAKMPTDANHRELAEKYDNISGSDIANAVFSASVKAARLNKRLVEHTLFEDAIRNIIRAKRENAAGNASVRRGEPQVLVNDIKNTVK